MERNSEILDKIGRNSGMTVPEGFFADFAARMAQSLPDKDVEQAPEGKRSLWLKVRPFAYLAAMFGGIWLMMQMFALMGNQNVDLSLDKYPGVKTALNDKDFVDDYLYPNIEASYLYDEIFDAGLDAEDFQLPDSFDPAPYYDFPENDIALENAGTEVFPESNQPDAL